MIIAPLAAVALALLALALLLIAIPAARRAWAQLRTAMLFSIPAPSSKPKPVRGTYGSVSLRIGGVEVRDEPFAADAFVRMSSDGARTHVHVHEEDWPAREAKLHEVTRDAYGVPTSTRPIDVPTYAGIPLVFDPCMRTRPRPCIAPPARPQLRVVRDVPSRDEDEVTKVTRITDPVEGRS